jgi:hypothetical protein
VRNNDTWQIDKPPQVRTDARRVDQWVQSLQDAKFEAADAGAAKTDSAFASATPVATVNLTTATGSQVLEIRKNKDDYYAKSSVVEGVYKVPKDIGLAVDKDVDDFRNQKIFDFGDEVPNKIELHDGSKIYELTRSGQDWSLGGKKMDLVSCLVLADKIRSLPAEKVVTRGFTTPAIDIAITSNDGKRTERVVISKNGANYVEKREGETVMYELPAASIQELEQAANDLKPADASAK